jgi:hypothetical protein
MFVKTCLPQNFTKKHNGLLFLLLYWTEIISSLILHSIWHSDSQGYCYSAAISGPQDRSSWVLTFENVAKDVQSEDRRVFVCSYTNSLKYWKLVFSITQHRTCTAVLLQYSYCDCSQEEGASFEYSCLPHFHCHPYIVLPYPVSCICSGLFVSFGDIVKIKQLSWLWS